jgi:hypothetical protein
VGEPSCLFFLRNRFDNIAVKFFKPVSYYSMEMYAGYRQYSGRLTHASGRYSADFLAIIFQWERNDGERAIFERSIFFFFIHIYTRFKFVFPNNRIVPLGEVYFFLDRLHSTN